MLADWFPKAGGEESRKGSQMWITRLLHEFKLCGLNEGTGAE